MVLMNRQLTSDELRIPARQAVTVALAMLDQAARTDLLARAEGLFKEAGAADRQRDGFTRLP